MARAAEAFRAEVPAAQQAMKGMDPEAPLFGMRDPENPSTAVRFPLAEPFAKLARKDEEKVVSGAKTTAANKSLKRAFPSTSEFEDSFFTLREFGTEAMTLFRNRLRAKGKTLPAEKEVFPDKNAQKAEVLDVALGTDLIDLSRVHNVAYFATWYLKKASMCTEEEAGDRFPQEIVDGALEILQFCVCHSLRMGLRLQALNSLHPKRRFLNHLSWAGKTLDSTIRNKLEKASSFGPDLFDGKLREIVSEAADLNVAFQDAQLVAQPKQQQSKQSQQSAQGASSSSQPPKRKRGLWNRNPKKGATQADKKGQGKATGGGDQRKVVHSDPPKHTGKQARKQRP